MNSLRVAHDIFIIKSICCKLSLNIFCALTGKKNIFWCRVVEVFVLENFAQTYFFQKYILWTCRREKIINTCFWPHSCQRVVWWKSSKNSLYCFVFLLPVKYKLLFLGMMDKTHICCYTKYFWWEKCTKKTTFIFPLVSRGKSDFHWYFSHLEKISKLEI